ncbi:diaminopimelate decarboxylase [Embleya sp. NPDC020886]|uniref:diaminopimelate decarboxylase n=1 Tax=Embleya sp. NPDC020886 TaxID=3363980 RepID=UPI0037A7E44D
MSVTLAEPVVDAAVWPRSTRAHGGDLAVGGLPLAELAERFGTPLYVLDEQHVRDTCRAYRRALPGVEIAYAAKAFLCRGLVRWLREEGFGLDVCSAGELALATSAGMPGERIILHGNAKSADELRAALRLGVGRIVLDNPAEIARLAALVAPRRRQRVMVRVVPGIEAGAHHAIRTGGEDQKFGLSIARGDATDAVLRTVAQPHLELTGLHCHLGSQIGSVRPWLAAIGTLVRFLAELRDRHAIVLPELNLGGGHGIAYRTGEHALDIESFAIDVRRQLARQCALYELPVPRLIVEPGRAVTGPAGVALYRVLVVKRTAHRVFVAVDGGMADNPRPALYGARTTVRLVGRPGAAQTRRVTVVGRYCESGDVLAPDVDLPDDIHPGDLLAIPAAGAYQQSMASTYNLVGRPPVIAVHNGNTHILLRRETIEDLLRRDGDTDTDTSAT